MFVMFYFYAVIGIEVYHPNEGKETETKYNPSKLGDFSSFGQALLALFQILTQSNWHSLMLHYATEHNYGGTLIYFFSFHTIVCTILLGLTTGLIWEIFTIVDPDSMFNPRKKSEGDEGEEGEEDEDSEGQEEGEGEGERVGDQESEREKTCKKEEGLEILEDSKEDCESDPEKKDDEKLSEEGEKKGEISPNQSKNTCSVNDSIQKKKQYRHTTYLRPNFKLHQEISAKPSDSRELEAENQVDIQIVTCENGETQDTKESEFETERNLINVQSTSRVKERTDSLCTGQSPKRMRSRHCTVCETQGKITNIFIFQR